MKDVRAKKHLGQHFLTDEAIAQRIGESLIHSNKYQGILRGRTWYGSDDQVHS